MKIPALICKIHPFLTGEKERGFSLGTLLMGMHYLDLGTFAFLAARSAVGEFLQHHLYQNIAAVASIFSIHIIFLFPLSLLSLFSFLMGYFHHYIHYT